LQPRLEHYTGRPVGATLDSWRPGDQPVYVSDTRKAAHDFAWQPHVGIDEGLRRLWTWAVHLNGAPIKAESRPKRPPLRLPLTKPDIALVGPPA
jgi:hypothetical protein